MRARINAPWPSCGKAVMVASSNGESYWKDGNKFERKSLWKS